MAAQPNNRQQPIKQQPQAAPGDLTPEQIAQAFAEGGTVMIHSRHHRSPATLPLDVQRAMSELPQTDDPAEIAAEIERLQAKLRLSSPGAEQTGNQTGGNKPPAT